MKMLSVYFMAPCTLLAYHNFVKKIIFKLLTLMVPDLLSGAIQIIRDTRGGGGGLTTV